MKIFKRIHIFNFLYSLFTLATGYLEVMNTMKAMYKNKGTVDNNLLALFLLELSSLIMAHIVVGVYLCCPKVSLNEPPQRNRNREL